MTGRRQLLRRAALAALLCLLLCVSACGGLASGPWRARAQPPATPAGLGDELEGSLTGGWMENREGSAVYLSGRTVLVSIFVQDLYSQPWDQASEQTARESLAIAAEYLIEAGAGYGREVELVYDTRQSADLRYQAALRLDANEADDERVNRQIHLWIDRNVDSEGLLREYEADGIGYLLFLKDEGTSFAEVYCVGDGPEWYYDRATLFYFDEYGDPEPPSVIAHEILHLFGAVDLYEPDELDGVTEGLIRYVEKAYPDEIMLTVYENDTTSVYDSVPFTLSPITAYCLGLSPDWSGLRRFPELRREWVACFE